MDRELIQGVYATPQGNQGAARIFSIVAVRNFDVGSLFDQNETCAARLFFAGPLSPQHEDESAKTRAV